ncbi:MAG: hypothetical protein EPN14_07805 [Gallionella sp.]|nr:MAG: hypothetical protein EPN14_07805 [Gallionella sp.]
MNILPVLDLLRQKIGLNPESVGPASVEKAVLEHIKTSGAADVDDYIRKIHESPAELKKLIESVVVPETSFFRNRIPFVTLKDYLRRFVLNKRPGKPVRILCVPCSTGEEPYSIAMTLFDMKLPASQFFIHAGDISEQALQFARLGVYSPYSFRGHDLDFRKTYFSKQDDTYILNKEIRDAVQFEHLNVLSDNFLPGHEPYDIIFCRNLLIYFDDGIKGKAIKALSKHLSGDGVLFVGHAEGGKIPQYGYASLDYPMSFAFAREEYAKTINGALNINTPAKKELLPPAPAQHPAAKPKLFNDTGKITPVIEKSGKNAAEEENAKKSPKNENLSKAKELAGKGAFDEVLAICEKLLSEGAESAEIYYLLGQAVESAGNILMAEEYLKKAIYLDADFYDALTHLSLLYDRMGSPEKAVSFRKRAQRVKSRNT